MPPKKPVTNYDGIRLIIREIAIAACTVISAFSLYINTQIKTQTDGVESASKRSVAISARALAVATKLPEDEKRATEAEAAADKKDKIQDKAEKPNP